MNCQNPFITGSRPLNTLTNGHNGHAESKPTSSKSSSTPRHREHRDRHHHHTGPHHHHHDKPQPSPKVRHRSPQQKAAKVRLLIICRLNGIEYLEFLLKTYSRTPRDKPPE